MGSTFVSISMIAYSIICRLRDLRMLPEALLSIKRRRTRKLRRDNPLLTVLQVALW